MKNKLLIIFLIVIYCFTIFGCSKNDEDNNSNKKIRYVIMNDDNGEMYKIYYYGIDSAIISVGDDNYDFEQAILTKTLTLDNILSDMRLDSVLYDGGTKIYRDSGSRKYFTDSYSIIRCNTIDGNKDIYIGNKDMEYEDDFCKFKTTDAEIKLQEEVYKMKTVKKIIIRNIYNNDIINTITNEDDIRNIIDMISRSIESTLVVTSDGTNLIIQMFDENDKLINSMYVWNAGHFGFKYNKEYFVLDKDVNIFNNMMKIN